MPVHLRLCGTTGLAARFPSRLSLLRAMRAVAAGRSVCKSGGSDSNCNCPGFYPDGVSKPARQAYIRLTSKIGAFGRKCACCLRGRIPARFYYRLERMKFTGIWTSHRPRNNRKQARTSLRTPCSDWSFKLRVGRCRGRSLVCVPAKLN